MENTLKDIRTELERIRKFLVYTEMQRITNDT